MLSSLPEQDLIAFHAFLYIMNMKSKINFFIDGTFDNKAKTLTAILSINSDGSIFENQADKGELTFVLTFSHQKHQAYINNFGNSENSSPENRLAHSFLIQVAPQLYTQALTFTAKQLSIKNNCLTRIQNLSKQKEIDVFSIYQQIMIPMVVRANVVNIH